MTAQYGQRYDFDGHNKQSYGTQWEVGYEFEAKCCLKALFHSWNPVKAEDTSLVGAFKTSMIEASHGNLDGHDESSFPSFKEFTKAKKLLNEEALRLIGYECKPTKCVRFIS